MFKSFWTFNCFPKVKILCLSKQLARNPTYFKSELIRFEMTFIHEQVLFSTNGWGLNHWIPFSLVTVGKDQGDLWEQKGWQLCAETLGQHLRRRDCEAGTPPPGLSGSWIGGRWGPGGAGPGSGLDWCLDWISAGWQSFQMSSCWVWRRDAVFLEVRGQGRQRLAENYEDWERFLPLQERACY